MHSRRIIGNSLFSVIYKILVLVLGFVSRKIFIVFIGSELLGLNSMYSNLLDLLNMAELGIGVAVQCSLYKPIVDGDRDKISGILGSARKVYRNIGLIVFSAGIVMTFFIQYLIKDNPFDLWYIRLAFFINAIGVSASYFMVEKRLFLQANEEIYITNIVDMIVQILITILSLISVIILKSYFLYLFLIISNCFISNLLIAHMYNKKYKNIYTLSNVDKTSERELIDSLKEVVPLKLSNFIYMSTDNIVISSFIGLNAVAIYTNYMLIFNSIVSFAMLISEAVKASFGKMIYEDIGNKKLYDYFIQYTIVQFLFTSFCSICLLNIIEPFITLWVGEKYLLSSFCLYLLIANFIIYTMIQPLTMVYSAAGIFKYDKSVTIIVALINIFLSVVLVNKIGVAGVVLGTLISNLISMASRIYRIISKYFEQNILSYLWIQFKYIAIIAIELILVFFICESINIESQVLEIIIRLGICLIVPNVINICLLIKNRHFISMFSIFKDNILNRK